MPVCIDISALPASGRREEWDLAAALLKHAGGLVGSERQGDSSMRSPHSAVCSMKPTTLDQSWRRWQAPYGQLLAVRRPDSWQLSSSARQLLEGDTTWRRLEDAQKATILRSVGLDVPSGPPADWNKRRVAPLSGCEISAFLE